jgi:hypothetical protein
MPHANGSWGSVLVDASIAAASAALAVLVTSPVPDMRIAYGALLAFGIAFFASLQAARGRKHGPEA